MPVPDALQLGPSPALLGGLLERFSEIVGEKAGYATFHFASVQEGLRMGASMTPDDLPGALGRLDHVLGHRSKLVEAHNGLVRLTISQSSLLESPNPVMRGIALGVMEGAFRVLRKRPLEGRIEARRENAHETDVVFEAAKPDAPA